MEFAHIRAWIHSLTASSDLDHALGSVERDLLADTLDIPSSYRGGGVMNSLSRSAYDK